MPQVYANNLSIARDDAGLRDDLLDSLRTWIGDRWPNDQAWFDAEAPKTIGLDDGSILRWEPFDGEEGSLYEFTWRHPHADDESISWATQVSMLRTDGGPELQLRVWNTGPEVGKSGALLTTRPRLVLHLAEAFDCRLQSDVKLTREPREIESDDLVYFVRYELLDPNRSVPMLITTPTKSGSFLIDPKDIADEFIGLAEVACIPEPEMTYDLTHEIGKRLSVFGGALRVYRPGTSRDDNPLRHPLLLPGRATQRSERYRLAQNLALNSARSFKGSEDIPRLRDQRAVAFQERRTALIEELREGSTNVETWRQLAEEQEEQNASLRADIERLQEENNDLHQRCRALRYRLNERLTAAGEDIDHEDYQPATVIEAVEIAQSVFSEDLLILNSALSSAEVSPFKRPEVIYEALHGMADISRRKKDGPLGANLKDVFAEFGLEYGGGISETSSDRHRGQYRFSEDGDVYVCEEHLKFGTSRDPSLCARIYFCSDHETEPRLVIGHVGRHLDVATTN